MRALDAAVEVEEESNEPLEVMEQSKRVCIYIQRERERERERESARERGTRGRGGEEERRRGGERVLEALYALLIAGLVVVLEGIEQALARWSPPIAESIYVYIHTYIHTYIHIYVLD
jgi:hypothetical protein